MKTVLKVIVILMVLGALSMLASTRLDGPRGLLAGGPFQSGADAISPADWSFLEGQDTLEFQTEAPERSRTVWLVVHDNRLFLVSGYMNTFVGKLWKRPIGGTYRFSTRLKRTAGKQSSRAIETGAGQHRQCAQYHEDDDN